MDQFNSSTVQRFNSSTPPFIKLNRCTLLFLLLFLTQTIVQAQQQDWQFVNQFGSNWMDNQNNNDEEIYDMSVDDSGNVYITGIVYGSNRIDGDTFTHPSAQATAFFAKFNCTGNLEWYHELDASNKFMARVINHVEPNSDSSYLYIINDNKIMKYTTNGDSTTFFKSSVRYNGFFDIDQNGNMYVLTSHPQGDEYAPGYEFAADDSFYLIKHDKHGNIQMFQPIIKSSINAMPIHSAMRINSEGNIFLGGTTNPIGEFHVIGGDTIDSDKGGGNTQAFLIKLDSLGNFIWSKQSEGGGGIR